MASTFILLIDLSMWCSTMLLVMGPGLGTNFVNATDLCLCPGSSPSRNLPRNSSAGP